jgi:subtilisin family serine protease
LERILALDPNAKVLAQVQLVLNAVFVEVDASVFGGIAADPAVKRVVPVGNYELDLSETVPYIGATAVQNSGFDGSGIKVAVLDSGIDYTHANLGGGGNIADFDAAYADLTSRNGLFPTADVVEGYDFFGRIMARWTLIAQ